MGVQRMRQELRKNEKVLQSLKHAKESLGNPETKNFLTFKR